MSLGDQIRRQVSDVDSHKNVNSALIGGLVGGLSGAALLVFIVVVLWRTRTALRPRIAENVESGSSTKTTITTNY
ncbi:hypothetical protein SISNIDRAFT_454698 [Sistotremastrum niveocremeum HHB9708]|uniref:Uncharacterized protein n=2 Tax=Sistotremastraceae TaxID=3402574 RepID=A0A164USL2_9AGAM|nr:hypothetical protein SISNIDRAFT_454698 [Sistotremastrum niveocremeum HHB9708]KZT42719.1 hypothetical protein SISSUDRAFT_1125565 [Sistotremastrum suecicum HHB10207 ss-3]